MKIMHLNGDGHEASDALADSLTSANPVSRIFGRAAGSRWAEQMAFWLDEELHRPNANPVDLLQAFAKIQVQHFASLIGSLADPNSIDATVDLYVEMVRNDMANHARMIQRMARGKRA